MTTRDEFEKHCDDVGFTEADMYYYEHKNTYCDNDVSERWAAYQAATYAAELKYKPLVEALQWYASLENYKSPQTLAFHHFNHAENPALMDKGKRALEALKSLQSVGGESV